MQSPATRHLRTAAIVFFALSMFSCGMANYMDPVKSHPGAINLASYGDTLRLPVAAGEQTCQEVLIAESTDGLWNGSLSLDFAEHGWAPYPYPDSVGTDALEVTLNPPGAPWGAQIPAGLGMEEVYTTMCVVVPRNFARRDTVERAVLRGSIAFPDRSGVSGFVNRTSTISVPIELRVVSVDSLASFRSAAESAKTSKVNASSLWGGSWLVNGIIALVCWGVYVNKRDRVVNA